MLDKLISGFFLIVGATTLLTVLLMFWLAIGESFQWWEFNVISDCNDYGRICSIQ